MGGLLGNCKTLRGSPEVFRWVGTLERRFQEMRSTPWECLAIEESVDRGEAEKSHREPCQRCNSLGAGQANSTPGTAEWDEMR